MGTRGARCRQSNEATMSRLDYLRLTSEDVRSPERWSPATRALHFLFPTSGGGLCETRGGPKPIHPGDVVVAEAGPEGPLEVRAADGEELVFDTFAVLLEHLYPIFAPEEIALLPSASNALREVRHHPAASAVASDCSRLLRDVPDEFTLDHRGQLLRVAGAVIAAELEQVRGRRGPAGGVDERLTRVFDSLSASEIAGLPVDDLAGRFGCSRRHLNRLFHLRFGLSVGALRMEMRLMKAVSLLQDPTAKVIHVAEECGFNHLGLFNNCFKRRFGTSPGQWRKNASGAREQPRSADLPAPLHPAGPCPFCGFPADGTHAHLVKVPSPPSSSAVGLPCESRASRSPSPGAIGALPAVAMRPVAPRRP